MTKWLRVLVLLPMLGCADRMLVELNRGTFCSAPNVDAYAKRRHLSYEQALAELRAKSDALWEQQEAQQRDALPSGEEALAESPQETTAR